MSAADQMMVRPPPGKLAARQVLVIVLLFGGYAAYYFCRADLSVAMPMLIDELHRHGMTTDVATERLGAMASAGVLAYAFGKLLLGGLGDLWGGRTSFLVGLTGAVVFTILFTLGGALPLFTIAWIGNRLVQSIGWPGLVKVCSRWFNYTSYGRIVGLLSLSYLLGDAVARQWMGLLIGMGAGWRTLFYLAAGVCATLVLANLLFLKESRTSIGLQAPLINPLNVFGSKPQNTRPLAIGTLLKPLLKNRGFWIVCFLSLGTTIIRETFNTWIPTYLHRALAYSEADAAGFSAIFPAIGIASVLLAGAAGDRMGAAGRAIILFLGMLITTAGLCAMASIAAGTQGPIPLILLGIVAFGLLGPYSYLAGAMALDFGGANGGATSSSIIDATGYFGGVLAGDTVARIAVGSGWRGVFYGLAGVAMLSAVASALLFIEQRRKTMEVIGEEN